MVVVQREGGGRGGTHCEPELEGSPCVLSSESSFIRWKAWTMGVAKSANGPSL